MMAGMVIGLLVQTMISATGILHFIQTQAMMQGIIWKGMGKKAQMPPVKTA